MAIVLGGVMIVLITIIIVVYIRQRRQSQQDDSMKALGFENASYNRSNESVHVGLENPGFSTS